MFRLLKLLPLLAVGLIHAQEEAVHSVYFEFDKFSLDDTQIKDAVSFIKNTDSTRIETIQIFGYTDDIGKDDYNFKLVADSGGRGDFYSHKIEFSIAEE